MTKRVFLVIILALLSAYIFACTPAIQEYDEHISEIRSNLFEGDSGSLHADAITGFREEPFDIDGMASPRQNFTVITIYPTEYTPSEKYTYSAVIDGTEYTGEMVKHPFNNTYSAEIQTLCSSEQISLDLTIGQKNTSINLVSIIQPSYISAEKALEIGVKKLSSGIRELKNSGTSFEIYIRLLKNPVSSSGGYHWYVAFVGENEATYAVLIDPITLDIVAIRD